MLEAVSNPVRVAIFFYGFRTLFAKKAEELS